MEEAEVAKQSTEFFDANTIGNIRRQIQENGPSADFCDSCGEPIPEARRKALRGCRLCVACKTIIEQGGRP